MLLAPRDFAKPAVEISNQQEANWFLYSAITGGEGSGGIFLEKRGDTMTGPLSFKPDDQRFGYFNIKGERPDGWGGSYNYGVRFQINDNTAFNKFVIQTNSESEAFFLRVWLQRSREVQRAAECPNRARQCVAQQYCHQRRVRVE